MTKGEMQKWLKEYFERYRAAVLESDVREELISLKDRFVQTHQRGRKIIFIGNGGSAAMASHCAVDLTKNAGVRCVNFNDADLITCFSNDFGYDDCFARALQFYADEGDCVVLISSSGRSPNILQAAKFARSKGLALATFTGFGRDNPLAQLGDLNFCVNSRAYNIIEMTHHIWLLAVCDLIIGKAEYPAKME